MSTEKGGELAMKTALVTGTSSGLGEGIADALLGSGHRVLGCSRRGNARLAGHPAYREACFDRADEAAARSGLQALLQDCESLELVVLNAGVLGTFGDLAQAETAELQHTMQVNLWANHFAMRALIDAQRLPQRMVAISSGAAVRGRRGWSGYALSKAALNMFVQLWAAELPDTHCAALAPGLVDTAMQDRLCGMPQDERYDSLDFLRGARDTEDMPTPASIAPRIVELCWSLDAHCESGGFVDVRALDA